MFKNNYYLFNFRLNDSLLKLGFQKLKDDESESLFLSIISIQDFLNNNQFINLNKKIFNNFNYKIKHQTLYELYSLICGNCNWNIAKTKNIIFHSYFNDGKQLITGNLQIDNVLGGFSKGKNHTFVFGSGNCKNIFCIGMTCLLLKNKYKVLYISLDSNESYINEKIYLNLFGLKNNKKDIHNPNLEENDDLPLKNEYIENNCLIIKNCENLSTDEILNDIVKCKKEHNIDVCVFDYPELCSFEEKGELRSLFKETYEKISNVAMSSLISFFCPLQASRNYKFENDNNILEVFNKIGNPIGTVYFTDLIRYNDLYSTLKIKHMKLNKNVCNLKINHNLFKFEN